MKGHSKLRHTHGMMCSVLAHGKDISVVLGPADTSRLVDLTRRICELLERVMPDDCKPERRHRPFEVTEGGGAATGGPSGGPTIDPGALVLVGGLPGPEVACRA